MTWNIAGYTVCDNRASNYNAFTELCRQQNKMWLLDKVLLKPTHRPFGSVCITALLVVEKLCRSWQHVSWHKASRGPSVIAELVVLRGCMRFLTASAKSVSVYKPNTDNVNVNKQLKATVDVEIDEQCTNDILLPIMLGSTSCQVRFTQARDVSHVKWPNDVRNVYKTWILHGHWRIGCLIHIMSSYGLSTIICKNTSHINGWLRGIVVERRSMTGELFLS